MISHSSALTRERSALLRIFHRIGFGHIEHLPFCGGQPVLDPLPRIVREHKFGGENGPRPEMDLVGFSLKRQVSELFDVMTSIGEGIIDRLEIRHGLPFRMFLTEGSAPRAPHRSNESF